MKIALISPLPPYRGGIANFSYLLISHLAQRHDLYAIDFRRLYPHILFPGKSQLHSDRTALATVRTDSILDALAPHTWNLAARQIEKFRPDICLFAYWMPFFIPVYWRIIRFLQPRYKSVFLCHNVVEHEKIPGLRWLKKRFFQAADQLVVLSSASRDQLKNLCVTTPTIVLFHPSNPVYGPELCQEDAKIRLGISPGIPTILFFGVVRPYKGLNSLIKAAAILKQQGVPFHLRVAGEFYTGYEKIADFISRGQLSEFITIENRFIPDEEVAVYFSAADVVALPYLTATQSGVIPIAYHFNRPVVATNVGGLPEVVQPGNTGYLVPPGNSDELAKVLGQNMPDGFNAMRNKVAKVKGQFSWESFTAQLERFLS